MALLRSGFACGVLLGARFDGHAARPLCYACVCETVKMRDARGGQGDGQRTVSVPICAFASPAPKQVPYGHEVCWGRCDYAHANLQSQWERKECCVIGRSARSAHSHLCARSSVCLIRDCMRWAHLSCVISASLDTVCSLPAQGVSSSCVDAAATTRTRPVTHVTRN